MPSTNEIDHPHAVFRRNLRKEARWMAGAIKLGAFFSPLFAGDFKDRWLAEIDEHLAAVLLEDDLEVAGEV